MNYKFEKFNYFRDNMGFMDKFNKKGIYSDSIEQRLEMVENGDLTLEKLVEIAHKDPSWQVRSAAYMR